jgi:hypothetical protein
LVSFFFFFEESLASLVSLSSIVIGHWLITDVHNLYGQG